MILNILARIGLALLALAFNPERNGYGDFWPQPTKKHDGAHALAPHQNVLLPPFFLWRNVLHLPADGLTLADDLSNLDELIKEILLRVQPPD